MRIRLQFELGNIAHSLESYVVNFEVNLTTGSKVVLELNVAVGQIIHTLPLTPSCNASKTTALNHLLTGSA